MAIFGTPFPLDDHRGAAIAAAVELRAAVARLNKENPASAFAIGIGIASGPMTVGIVGSPSRMEFTCIGDTVNTASRLESLCKEFKTDLVLAESTVTGGAWAGKAKSLGATTIRGKEQELRIYTLEA
jgi:adenylate cyclase